MSTASAQQVPLTVIGGFLGAGKTTLLNRVLREAHGVRYGVLVNDFGSLDVDGALVTEHGGDTVSFANGCVCCTLGDSMLFSVDRLLERAQPPQQFLVEASGVADPRGIADLATLHPRLRRDLIIVLADAETLPERAADVRLADTVERQLRSADLLVLNRCDRLSDSAVDGVEQWLRSRSGAPCVRTVQAALPLELLHAEPRAAEPERGPVPAHEHHPQSIFHSVSVELLRPVDLARLRGLLETLAPGLLRAKGFVRSTAAPQHWQLVQLAGRQLTVQPCAAPASRQSGEALPAGLVLIGTGDLPDAAAITEALYAADDR